MTKPLSTLTFPSCDAVAKLHFEGVRILQYKLDAQRYAEDFYEYLRSNR